MRLYYRALFARCGTFTDGRGQLLTITPGLISRTVERFTLPVPILDAHKIDKGRDYGDVVGLWTEIHEGMGPVGVCLLCPTHEGLASFARNQWRVSPTIAESRGHYDLLELSSTLYPMVSGLTVERDPVTRPNLAAFRERMEAIARG